nr:MAG TPA: hypothetical protein [Bacteriophage sp.]
MNHLFRYNTSNSYLLIWSRFITFYIIVRVLDKISYALIHYISIF